MARKILAILTIILGASSSIAYLYYAPSHLTLSITDPPPTPYSNNITATHVTLTLMTLLSTSKLLGTAQLPTREILRDQILRQPSHITIDGTNTTYTIPSGNQTGIK